MCLGEFDSHRFHWFNSKEDAMAFKNLSGAQHMNAEVSKMMHQVFSGHSHLIETAGTCIGYGEVEGGETLSDDPYEAMILDLLSLDPGAAPELNASQVRLVLQRHAKMQGDCEGSIEKLMRSAWVKKLG
jgi:hypothetical protein